MQRSKDYTVQLHKMSLTSQLTGEEKRLARLLTLVLLEDKRYRIPDQPGCENLPITQSSRGFGGFDLNYPRTIELHFNNGQMRVYFGLSGTIYQCSDEEVQFARDVIDTFSEVERAFKSEGQADEKDIGVILATKNRFEKIVMEKERVAKLIAKVAENRNQTVQYLTLKVSEFLQ